MQFQSVFLQVNCNIIKQNFTCLVLVKGITVLKLDDPMNLKALICNVIYYYLLDFSDNVNLLHGIFNIFSMP